jgi:hypothetical protein
MPSLAFLAFFASAYNLDLPILRRIASDKEWPPLRIYVYPEDNFSSEFREASKKSGFGLEQSLFSKIRSSKVHWDSPKDADLYLVPMALSSYTKDQFHQLLKRLAELGPYYSEYKGANHIFVHSHFPTDVTAVNSSEFFLHPGHFITGGFQIEGRPVDSWVYAKNLLIPVAPQTTLVSEFGNKLMQIAVDGTTDKCLPQNAALRKSILARVAKRTEYVVGTTDEEFRRLLETSTFAVVTACESLMVPSFYDAVHAGAIPIVMNNAMRFPFENELIDYNDFVVHLSENETALLDLVSEKVKEHVPEMQKKLVEARKMFEMTTGDGKYVWALAWSLYMKLLAWLPIRRTKLIENIFNEPQVMAAL